MLKKFLEELITIRKELQDIKLILKFQYLGKGCKTDWEKADRRAVIKGRHILPDPLEELRKEENTLQQYRKNKIDYLPNK